MSNLQQIICVYKIISPSKKVYIGSTVNFKARLNSYKNLDCKPQTKLYRSLKKYGFDKHKFEIICECDLSDVRQKEAYYGQLYNCLSDKHGLNCIIPSHGEGYISRNAESIQRHRVLMTGKKTGPRSEKSKKNISNGRIGMKFSEEHKLNLSKGQTGIKRKPFTELHKRNMSQARSGISCGPLSEQHKAKLSEAGKGHIVTTETRAKISKANKGRSISKEQKAKLLAANLGRKRSQHEKDKIRLSMTGMGADILLNTQTGIYYYGYKEAAKSLSINIHPQTLNHRTRANKTPLIVT